MSYDGKSWLELRSDGVVIILLSISVEGLD